MKSRIGWLLAAAAFALGAQQTTPQAKPVAPKPAAATPKAASTAPAATAPKPAAAKPAAPAAAAAKPVVPARPPGLYATLAITEGAAPMGSITFKLFEREAPITVKNFTDLALGRKKWTIQETGESAMRPFFNGLTFHRVIPGFMIQGGDPLGNGTGGTEVIPDEFHPDLKFDIPGRVAMANRGPDTGSCQFFITEVPTPHLTGRHTIFGQVVSGQELVERIARVPRGPNDRPNTPVRIARVTIQRSGPDPNAPVTKKTAPAKKTAAPAALKAAAPAASAGKK
jgi:peptidyl-prolyl cis-trans isomerase A (cyclophilin A)